MTDTTKKLLTVEDILSANDIHIEWCPVPEWGDGSGGVYVKSMAGDELDAYQGSMLAPNGKGKQRVTYANMRAKLAVKVICDAEGHRLFNDSQVDLLAKKNAAGLARVFELGAKLSGLGEDDIKELEDNLKNDPSGDLPSG